MKFFLTALTSALLASQVVQVQSQQADDHSNIPAEEYAIYAAALGDMFPGDKVSSDSQSKAKLLVIDDQTISNNFAATVGEDGWKRVKQEFSSVISQETIDDYVAKNAKSHQLTKSFDLKLKYTLVPKEKIDQIFKNGPGGWGEFYRQFPDSVGLIALSRAGLNSGGNQAFVYISHGCGGLCGSGHYMLLVKNGQRWVVQKKFMAWVS
jgi:hypothetical protein